MADCGIDVESLTILLDGYCNKCGMNKFKIPRCGECGIVRIKNDLEDFKNQKKAYEIRAIEREMNDWIVPLSLSERKFMEDYND